MKNRILKALPPQEYRILSAHLSPVILPPGVLYEPGDAVTHVLFPNDSMASYLSGTAEGKSIEIAVVGNEGVIGIPLLLAGATAFQVAVQIAGSAYRIQREILRREIGRCAALRDQVLRYDNALLIQVAQTAVCNKFHSVQQRFCRWLLIAHDHTRFSDLSLTQDSIARILGTRRASITVAAGSLQRAGVIGYRRGVMTLLDRKKLEAAACECYQIIASSYSRIDRTDLY